MNNKFIQQIKKGFKIFMTITILTLLLIFVFTLKDASKESILSIFKNIKIEYLLLALLLWVAGIMIDGLRVQVLTRGIGKKISLLTGIEIIVSGIFLATVTPFQTGGLPVQLYILHKNKISPGEGTVILLFRGIFQMLTTILAIPLIISFFPKNALTVTLFTWVIVIISIGISVSLWISFNPKPARHFSHRIGRWIWKKKGKKPRKFFLLIAKIFTEIKLFKKAFRKYIKNGKSMLILAFLLTIVFLFFYYLIPAFLLNGIGIFNFKIIETIAIQIILTFAFLFAPTPGGSGIAELGFGGAFSQFIPDYMPKLATVSLLTLAWRIITCYIPTIIGAIITLKVLHIEKENLDQYQQN